MKMTGIVTRAIAGVLSAPENLADPLVQPACNPPATERGASDGACSTDCLGRLEGDPARGSLEGATHREATRLQVEVVPAEAEEPPATHPEGEEYEQRDSDGGVLGGPQAFSHLIFGREASFQGLRASSRMRTAFFNVTSWAPL